MTMKKIAALALSLTMCASMLAACGDADSSSKADNSSAPDTTSAPADDSSDATTTTAPTSSAPDESSTTTEAEPEKPVGPAAVEITDESKIFVGDIEAKGNVRIELFNTYGFTASEGCAFDIESFEFNGGLSVTFDIAGLPDQEKEYDAFLMFTNNDWSWGVWDIVGAGAGAVKIKGDGTYTVFVDNALPFGKEGEIGNNGLGAYVEDTLVSVWAPAVFCVDIIGLGTDLGIVPEEETKMDMHGCTVSNVKIEYWQDGSRPEAIQERIDAAGTAAGGEEAPVETTADAE